MTSKHIYIFLEGDDDSRFFDYIIKPLLEAKGCCTEYVYQSKMKRISRAKFIMSIKNYASKDFIFAKDVDVYPCVSSRKENIKKEFGESIDDNRIVVVAKTIESWYLAGVDARTLRRLHIKVDDINKIDRSTNTIDKAQFNGFFPRDMVRAEIMCKLLEHYDIEVAKRRNKSFNYFIDKFINSTFGTFP